MENVRMIIGGLGGLLFLLQMYILMGSKHFKFTFINSNKLYSYLGYISLLLSIIAIMIGEYLYNKLDLLLILVIIFNVFNIIVKAIFKFMKKKNTQNDEFISVKSGEYEISSDISVMGFDMIDNSVIMSAKSIMKLRKENKETFILFQITPPKDNKNIVMSVKKCKENNFEYYLCTSYMYEERSLIDWLGFLFNIYVILVFVYGCIRIMNLYFTIDGIVNNDNILSFAAIPVGYFLFNFGFKSTKNGKDGFNKFFHYLFGLLYIIVTIEVVVIWFVYK